MTTIPVSEYELIRTLAHDFEIAGQHILSDSALQIILDLTKTELDVEDGVYSASTGSGNWYFNQYNTAAQYAIAVSNYHVDQTPERQSAYLSRYRELIARYLNNPLDSAALRATVAPGMVASGGGSGGNLTRSEILSLLAPVTAPLNAGTRIQEFYSGGINWFESDLTALALQSDVTALQQLVTTLNGLIAGLGTGTTSDNHLLAFRVTTAGALEWSVDAGVNYEPFTGASLVALNAYTTHVAAFAAHVADTGEHGGGNAADLSQLMFQVNDAGTLSYSIDGGTSYSSIETYTKNAFFNEYRNAHNHSTTTHAARFGEHRADHHSATALDTVFRQAFGADWRTIEPGFIPLTDTGQLVTPTMETRGRASIFGHQIYVGSVNPGNPGSGASWDWNSMTSSVVRTATGVNNAFWRGTHSTEDAIGSPADGHYAYITNRHHLRRYEGYWEDAYVSVFGGAFTSQADAEAHITTVGRWAWWPGPQGLQYLNAYTAPTSAEPDEYSWTVTGYTDRDVQAFITAWRIALINIPNGLITESKLHDDVRARLGASGTTAIVDLKGPVWAISPTITAGTYNNNVIIPFGASEHWNIQDAAPGGVAHGVGTDNESLHLPALAPTGTLGLWLSTHLNGSDTAIDETQLNWGHGDFYHSTEGTSGGHLAINDARSAFLQVRWTREDLIKIYGTNTAITDGITVRARPIIVSAFKGDKGDPGDVSAAGLASGISDHNQAVSAHDGRFASQFNTHNQSSTAHQSIRSAAIATHNTGTNSHQDIRGVHLAHEQNVNAHLNAVNTRIQTHNAQNDAHPAAIDAKIATHDTMEGAHLQYILERIQGHENITAHQDIRLLVTNHEASITAHRTNIDDQIGVHNQTVNVHQQAFNLHNSDAAAHELIRSTIITRTEIQDWTLNTLFYTGQIVIRSPNYYFCIVSHTSGGALDSAPENNHLHWREMTLGGGLHMHGTFSGSTTTANRFYDTAIDPTSITPTPMWLHIRNGLSQGTGIHGEFIRIRYSEWAAVTTATVNDSRNSTNNVVLGNIGGTGGTEIHLGRTNGGNMMVATSGASTFDDFEVWFEL